MNDTATLVTPTSGDAMHPTTKEALARRRAAYREPPRTYWQAVMAVGGLDKTTCEARHWPVALTDRYATAEAALQEGRRRFEEARLAYGPGDLFLVNERGHVLFGNELLAPRWADGPGEPGVEGEAGGLPASSAGEAGAEAAVPVASGGTDAAEVALAAAALALKEAAADARRLSVAKGRDAAAILALAGRVRGAADRLAQAWAAPPAAAPAGALAPLAECDEAA